MGLIAEVAFDCTMRIYLTENPSAGWRTNHLRSVYCTLKKVGGDYERWSMNDYGRMARP